MGDLKCPKCGNNSFQVRSQTDAQRATFICISCWGELRLEDMTRHSSSGIKSRSKVRKSR